MLVSFILSLCVKQCQKGLYTRWELDSESGKLKPCQNKTRSFANIVLSYLERLRPQCMFESFYTTGTQKNIDAYSVDGFYGHCNTVFEAMRGYYHYCPCQETRPSLTVEEIWRGIKQRELDELRKHNTYKKMVITSLRCMNVIGGTCTRQIILLNSICANLFPIKCLSEKKLFWRLSNQEAYLVLFNVILKYPRNFEKLLLKNMPTKKEFWLKLGEC